MTSINLMGAYSGIDMSVIDQLVEAEKAKGVKFTNRKQNIETERSAWKDINTRLDNLNKKLDALTKSDTFESRTVSSNMKDGNFLSVSASDVAATGTYRVAVEQLATATRLTGGQVEVDSIYADLFTKTEGSFTINYPTSGETSEDGQLTINLEEGETYSLKDIENLINNHEDNKGIQASIIDRRLVLTNKEFGDKEITVTSDDGSSKLLTTLKLNDATLTELTEGQAAKLTINGVEIESNSNTIDDVVEGLTFNLENRHAEGVEEVITVNQDSAKTTKAVKEFVDQYNSTMRFIEEQMDVGDPSAEDNKTGALTGDGTVMRLQTGLRSILNNSFSAEGVTGDIRSIEDLGIEIDRYGVASFDESKFKTALQDDPTNVARFFYRQDTVAVPTGVEGEEPTSEFKRDGVSELFKNFIDTYISTRNGIIKNKNESYDRMLKDIEQQIETFNERVDRKRDRYIQQFTALDIAMMQAQSQLDYMYSQLGIEAQ